jgi:hypothetical protein
MFIFTINLFKNLRSPAAPRCPVSLEKMKPRQIAVTGSLVTHSARGENSASIGFSDIL